MIINNNPALTYTLSDFVELGKQDEMTYNNFSIIRYRMSTEFAEQNIVDYYLSELRTICLKITSISEEEINRYKYAPDLLAYDVYGTTQLDFIVLLCNGIIDPKEFDFKRKYLLLPKADALKEFLSRVYNSESDWININRTELKKEKEKSYNSR